MRICGGCEKVRVIQPDGQVRQLELPVSVGDLLRLHPHHYVREAITRRSRFRASIMPVEAQLESGGIYLLLPLPRLFPSSASAPPLPPPCACFLRDNKEQEQEQEKRAKCGPSIWMGKRRQYWLLFFTSCIAHSCKVSPEGVGLGLGLAGSIRGGVMKRSRIWEPSLEMILENDILYPQTSSRKRGELLQEKKPGSKRIEHRVPKPGCSSSSSCKPKTNSSSSCLRAKKRDANANVHES